MEENPRNKKEEEKPENKKEEEKRRKQKGGRKTTKTKRRKKNAENKEEEEKRRKQKGGRKTPKTKRRKKNTLDAMQTTCSPPTKHAAPGCSFFAAAPASPSSLSLTELLMSTPSSTKGQREKGRRGKERR
jgi:hypothetical protein